MAIAVQNTAEFRRVLGLARHAPTAADCEALSDALSPLLRQPGSTARLRPLQALALYYVVTQGAAFIPLDVGAGKTLVSLVASAVSDAEWAMLLLPANLIDKTKAERDRYAKDWRIPNTTSMVSYQSLGRKAYADLLETQCPPMLIADEAHYLKSLDSAVTRRVARYMAKHPGTHFLPMTGTPMRDSLKNFAHLMAWSLKEHTPLPMGPELHDWANALDERPDGQEDWEERPELGALTAFGSTLAEARQGLRTHIVATPGVVALAQDQPPEVVPYQIHIRGLLYDVAKVTHDHVARLRKEGLTPDDWPITPADAWRHTRELVTGFHYIQVDANGNRPPEEWRQPRTKWFAFVRAVLGRSRTYDSPEQVQEAVLDGRIPNGKPILEAWTNVKDSFRPVPVPVWHDDSALEYVARWAAQQPGLIWVEHVAFAEALAKRTGLVYYRERGLDRDGNPVERAPLDRSVILSVKANKEGRNLQAWNRNLIVAPREGADEWHQLIGRTARPGQTRDVQVDVMVGCAEHQLAWERANAAAQAILDTTGNGSKLLAATSVDWPPTYAMTGPLWAGR